MKGYIKIAMAVCMVVAMMAAVPAVAKKNGGKARMEFKEYVWDFGVIKENGGPVSHEFEYTNTGNGNLVVVKATVQCGCTRPSYPEKPTAPGKSGKVKVTYLPAGRRGNFESSVTLVTNGDPKKIRLRVKGNIVPGK